MTKEEASKVFKALGDPNRLKIIKLLMNNKEICACKLLEVVECKQATLSFHLSILKDANLVTSVRDGKNIIYSCNMDLIKSVLDFMYDICPECGLI